MIFISILLWIDTKPYHDQIFEVLFSSDLTATARKRQKESEESEKTVDYKPPLKLIVHFVKKQILKTHKSGLS